MVIRDDRLHNLSQRAAARLLHETPEQRYDHTYWPIWVIIFLMVTVGPDDRLHDLSQCAAARLLHETREQRYNHTYWPI